jgi:hypothetical protein
VLPPSGRQILQLFVVPAIIVLVLVGLFLLGPSLAGLFRRASADTRTAEQFLNDIDSSNADIRWRAASDLAQVLLRKDELAADPDFALALAERLQNALDSSAEPEKKYAARYEGLTEGEKQPELKKLEPDRNLITYLAASLGNCMLPVGAPLLERLATQTEDMEPDALVERRGRALFALATLGENLKRYDRLSDEQKDDIEDKLKQAENREGNSARARATLAYLQARRQGKADTMGVADTLAKCADDEDPYLRELSALASNFWYGTAKEDGAIESFLVRLSDDAGAGADRMEERLRRNPNTKDSRAVTTKKGFNVQANAAIALARRGSPRVRLDLLQEMLDPARLREIFVIRPRGGSDRPDEALVVLTLTNTLKAVAELHRKRPEMKLDRLVPLIDNLAASDNPAVRAEAKQTQLALGRE